VHPAQIGIRLLSGKSAHDPEKLVAGLDPAIRGFPKRSCANKRIKRDGDSI
jgi:hypothetical protein